MLNFLRMAADAAERTGSEALPPDVLRFALEYKKPPDLQAERDRFEDLLEADGFDLFSYSAVDDPALLILQFRGVRLEQSSAFLFRVGDELAKALELVSAVPEVGPAWVEANAVADQSESVGDIVWENCRSKATAPSDPEWARKMIRADRANIDFSTGKDALVGQPDTGVADHVELTQGLDKTRAYNFVDDTSDPTDPLSSSMSSPGHGTATSSIAISRASNLLTGSAPKATLIPIRCINGVVIGTGVPVAKAIDHARRQGCHIISMSLGGGIEGRTLRKAIQRAVDADMVVLAAAGNCVGFVVYPAWDPNVIAVAGVDEHKNRWKGSSRGRKIDIAAPGENVHVARRQLGSNDTTDVDKGGQGTSFAVALTAGCAALWVDRFGIGALKNEARRRGTNVQELFRAAIRGSAQTPANWDSANMGAGIVDAHKLLSTVLVDIPPVSPLRSGSPLAFLFNGQEAVEQANIPSGLYTLRADPRFARHEVEASFLASDALVRIEPSSTPLENASAPSPSAGLAELLADTGASGLPSPHIALGPVTPPETPADLAGRIAASPGGAMLESASDVQTMLDQVEKVISYRSGERPGSEAMTMEIMGGIERSVAVAARPEGIDDFSTLENRMYIEALVELVGRPSLRVRDGDLPFDIADPALGQWAEDLIPLRDEIGQMACAVGRIDILTASGWTHVGTGFVYENGVIMTNRHVLDAFAEPFPTGPGQSKMHLTAQASINFDPDATDDSKRFSIKGVAASGAHRIGSFVDFSKLDMALLEIETSNGHVDQPQPIGPATETTSDGDHDQVFLIGYPAEPGHAAAPADIQAALAYWDRIRELYLGDFSTKYLSPGLVKRRPGQLNDGGSKWVFSHDATTMYGSSGSAVAVLGQGIGLCGLHFGGRTFSQNLAHDLKAVDFAEDLV